MLFKKRFSKPFPIPVLLLLLLFIAPVIHAQGRATIFGTVTDPSGAVVPNAQIILTNVATQQKQVSTTTSDGSYVLPSLPVGVYQLSASAQGFQTFIVQQIVLQVDENREIPVHFAVGSTTQEVTVSSNPAQVDTRTPALTQVVDEDRVKDLPLNGRNALQLQYLVPGAGGIVPNAQGENEGVSINGNRPNENNYTLDGTDNEDPFFNSPSVVPNPDALDQFSMKTSNYGAQEGRNAGGMMNAVIKSGTNQFHGVLFDYFRNQVLDAAGYFATSRPPYRRNQFGGTLGGPIWRNKMFFFFAYQGTRQNSSPSVLTPKVPSAAERAGDLSEISKQLKVPGTKKPAPSNDLSAYLNPAAVQFMNDFVPLPNAPNNIYSYAPTSVVDEDQYIGKVDASLGAKDTISGHLVYVVNKNTEVPADNNLPGFLAQINYINWNIAVNETHTFSPHMLNLFTFGWNDIQRHQLPIVPKQETWADLGTGIVRAVPDAPIAWDTQVNSYFRTLSRWPLTQLRAGYEYSDQLTWTFGNHSLVIGGDVRQQYTDQSQSFQSDAQVFFKTSFTGDALGDFLTGYPGTIKQQSFNAGKPANTVPDLFIQDDWRVTRRLTLDLGLRWEPFIPMHDRLHRVVQFLPGEQSTVMPSAPLGYVFPGDPGVPPDGYPANNWRFGPRFGFAYDVFGTGKTSLRGGVGIYNGVYRTQAQNGSSTDVPYSLKTVINSPSGGLDDPYAGIGGSPFPYNPPSPADYATYVPPTPLTVDTLAPNSRGSRVTQWNLNVQQQLPWQIVTTIAYVGTNGEYLDATGELNPAVYSAPGKTVDDRRIYAPDFGSIQEEEPAGHSNYHALQASLNKRMSHGVTVLASYTWAKSIDNVSGDGQGFTDPFNYSLDRGLSDFDIRHTFVTSFIWRLPATQRQDLLTRTFVKRWEINGIIHLYTGSPFGVGSGEDNSGSGVNADMADRVGPIVTYRGRSKQQQIAEYFDVSSFVPNAPGTFGNSGRNIIIGPGYSNVDLGMVKTLPSPEMFQLKFRAEAFNVFNHANLANPTADLSSSSVGQISSQQGDPRVLQLALRLEF